MPDKISYGFLLDILRGVMALGKSIRYLPKLIERAESLLYENPALSSKNCGNNCRGADDLVTIPSDNLFSIGDIIF